MRPSASRTGSRSASARGVGTSARPSRTSSGSPKSLRSRASVLLMPGWLSPSLSAARVTLRSASSASSATRRFRSTPARLIPPFSSIYCRGQCSVFTGSDCRIPSRLPSIGPPSERLPMDREDVPVLIVGGSLVGLSAALFLRQHGVDVLAVERHAGTAIHSRAGHFHLRTVEILRSAGLEDAVRRRSEEQYPPDGGINNVESLAGREIANSSPNLNPRAPQFRPTPRPFTNQ